MANGQPLTLTARAIAFGAFGGVLFLSAALLGLHALFTYLGLEDGGVIKDLLPVVVGSITTTFGIVVGALFGTRTPD
jgi:hypothetical protein